MRRSFISRNHAYSLQQNFAYNISVSFLYRAGQPDEFYDGKGVSIYITSANGIIAEENIKFAKDPNESDISFQQMEKDAGFLSKIERVEFCIYLDGDIVKIPGIMALIELLQKMAKLSEFAFTRLVPGRFVYYFLGQLTIFNARINGTIYITECYNNSTTKEVIQFYLYFKSVKTLIVRNASIECFMGYTGIKSVSFTHNAIRSGIEPELFYTSTLEFISKNMSTLETVEIISIEMDHFWRFALALCTFNMNAAFSVKYFFTAASYKYVEYKTIKYQKARAKRAEGQLINNKKDGEVEEEYERRMKLETNALDVLIGVIKFGNESSLNSKQIIIQSIAASIGCRVSDDEWIIFRHFITDRSEQMEQGESIMLSFTDETFKLLSENVNEFMKNDGVAPYVWQFLASISGNVLPEQQSALESMFQHAYLRAITFIFTSSDGAEDAKSWNCGTGWKCGEIDRNVTNGVLFVKGGDDNGGRAG